jgi:hypothetical protein
MQSAHRRSRENGQRGLGTRGRASRRGRVRTDSAVMSSRARGVPSTCRFCACRDGNRGSLVHASSACAGAKKRGIGFSPNGRKQKQISRRPRSLSANARAPRNDSMEVPAREPVRWGFGATRVGALLGRLRLHLQTDRFLAAHRGDAMWEAGCLPAALALAEIVSGMAEEEMAAALPPQRTQNRRALGTPALPQEKQPRCSAGLQLSPRKESARPGLQGPSHPSECEGWGTRKTGSATRVRCGTRLERSGR